MNISRELQMIIGDEPIDFKIFPKRESSVIESSISIGFGCLFWGIPLMTLYFNWVKFFDEDEYVNEGVILFVLMFGILGLLSLISGISQLFRSGGCFVGTPTRLIHQKGNNKIVYHHYETFTGNCDISLREKSLTYILSTGKIQRRGKKNIEYFVPDKIEIVGVENYLDIEKMIRKRIEECKNEKENQ